MNKRQLLALGVPEDCVSDAVACIHAAAKAKILKQRSPKKLIPQIIASPDLFTSDAYFGDLAKFVFRTLCGECDQVFQWFEEFMNPRWNAGG